MNIHRFQKLIYSLTVYEDFSSTNLPKLTSEIVVHKAFHWALYHVWFQIKKHLNYRTATNMYWYNLPLARHATNEYGGWVNIVTWFRLSYKHLHPITYGLIWYLPNLQGMVKKCKCMHENLVRQDETQWAGLTWEGNRIINNNFPFLSWMSSPSSVWLPKTFEFNLGLTYVIHDKTNKRIGQRKKPIQCCYWPGEHYDNFSATSANIITYDEIMTFAW